MKDEDLLNAVFRFKYKAPSDRQDAATCVTFAKWFAVFAGKLEAVDVAEHKCSRVEPLADDRVIPASSFSVHEVDILQQVARRLTAAAGNHKRGDVWYDPWLPMYGCALQRTMLNATTVKLEVIFVDGWERTLHFLPNGECVHSAVPKTHHILHCADLDTELEMKFGIAFKSELQNAQLRKGSERSAANNALGHQKTPQFIAAVVRRAVVSLGSSVRSINCTSKGGTTDVGQHTGGRARDTCWALVQAVIAQNICCGQGLFRKTMVAIELGLLRLAISEVDSKFYLDEINLRDGCASVDDVFYMLQMIVLDVVGLLESGYDVSVLEKECIEFRVSIDKFVDTLNRQSATRYVLPEADILQKLNQLKCGVEIASPKRDKDTEDAEGREASHDRAWATLKGCCYLNGSISTLDHLFQWMTSNLAPASYKSILSMRTIESFMYSKSRSLCDKILDDEHLDLEAVQTLVTRYQAILRQWRQQPQLTSVLSVEQRSREMLVLWISFCLVHQQCVVEVPLCAQYNIALDWTDLKVAVLSDRAAISALQNVTWYIRKWNTTTNGPPLFHLTNQEPTFKFGQTFGLSSTNMIAIYNLEVEIWEAHVRNNWGAIEVKKREAAELRADIERLNSDLWTNQRALANEEERLNFMYPAGRYSWGYRTSGAKTQLSNEVNRIRSAIQRKEEVLTRTLQVPPYLVRPVPPVLNDAIQVIFMLMLPRNLEILGSLCLTAQRSLAPIGATSEMMTLPTLSPTTWQQFYYQRAPSRALTATAKVFTASLAPFSLPSSWGPSTVDGLYNLYQYKAECVWEPSLAGTALTWMDNSGSKMNPFNGTEMSVINSFIEQVPQSYRRFQWMNSWPGENDIRGNLVYANLHQQPEEFEKMSFIALGSLRAFPNQQYRKLQWALLEDILPWSHSCVEIIVRQSVIRLELLLMTTNQNFYGKPICFTIREV